MYPKPSHSKETVDENQALMMQKKVEKLFGHLDPENPPETCPIRDILSPVIDKWSILIILFLGGYEVLRFNQLKKRIYGVSSKSLTERLKILERDGYILRKVYTEVPIRVEYQLSNMGYKYLEQLLNLTEWIDQQMPGILKKRYKFDQIIKTKK